MTQYLRGDGCGNTFIIYDCLETAPEAVDSVIREAHARLIAEKRDDALILKKEYHNLQKYVLKMIVLEPDGSIAEFCGNGARVVSRYLQRKFGNQKMRYYLKTSGGLRKIWWQDNLFYVDMGKTQWHLSKTAFLKPKLETFTLGLGIKQFTFYWTETMEPHLVTFDAMKHDELHDLGFYLNHQQRHYFPLGINLNMAQVTSDCSLSVVTYERGVNRITAGCGTGATSCAMLALEMGLLAKNKDVTVSLKGGFIMIQPKEERAIMFGPANIEA